MHLATRWFGTMRSLWPAPTSTSNRSTTLDFIRGIAILLAMGWHFNNVDTGFPPLDWLLAPGRTLGWAGVDLFFVLSGFLVGGLIFKEYRATGHFRPGRFLIRRAFKIWPILYLYLALLLLAQRHPWDSFLLQTLFHVQNYADTSLDHLWSLAIEEHFYLSGALLFAAATSLRHHRRHLLIAVMAAIPVACLAMRSAALHGSYDIQDIAIETHFRIDALVCGVCAGYVHVYHPALFERWARHKKLLLLAFIAGATVLGLQQDNKPFTVTVGYTIAYLTGLALLMFCHGLKSLTDAGWLVRRVSTIGLYSYAMYIYQFVGMRAAESLLNKLGVAAVPAWIDLAIQYGGALAVAVVVTNCVERPMLRLRDRLFPSATASASIRVPEIPALYSKG